MTRGNRRAFSAALVVCLAAVATLLGPIRTESGPASVTVWVGDRRVEVDQGKASIANVLKAARVKPRDGALRSASSGRVLDAHSSPARMYVNGARASISQRVVAGARVRVVDGQDRIEPVEVRQHPVPAPPGPPVESLLWYPGKDGVDEVTVGTVSGEIVSSSRVAEPVPPRREEGNVVSLTFDDGPHPTWTPAVLQILAEEGVKATFCMVGDMVRKRPELTRTVLAQGHTLCSHTLRHAPDMDRLPEEEVAREITGGADLLKATTGQPVSLYRSPAGRLTPAAVEIAQRHGMRVLDWTLDSRDFQRRPAVELIQNVLAGVKPGAVILLHDGGGSRATTVEALRPMIHELRARGFQFATPLAPPPPPPAPPDPNAPPRPPPDPNAPPDREPASA
ncbi:MAG TPA: polysaccharide deacetylase family protein [Acidimicrobiales bacterium]|nr:polysaccharide deacetylase family protein [Acidimicrobiales bacterium]